MWWLDGGGRLVGQTEGEHDGEIKAARRSPAKPLIGLGFLRAGRSGRVPLLGKSSIISTGFSTLSETAAAFPATDEQQQRRFPRPPRTHPRQPARKDEDLHPPGAPSRAAG